MDVNQSGKTLKVLKLAAAAFSKGSEGLQPDYLLLCFLASKIRHLNQGYHGFLKGGSIRA